MIRIAFDESGNTGQNLLDKIQPYFTLASVNYSDLEARELCDIFDSSAQELHFKTLKKYSKSKRQLLKFCNHEYISSNKVKCYIANKEMALSSHVVDRFIEPVMYNLGTDIYKDRSNIIFANLLYSYGKRAWNSELVENFHKKFQEFIRNPNKQTIGYFYKSNQKLIDSISDEDPIELLNIIKYSESIKNEIINSIEPNIIDLAFPTFNVLANSWYVELNSKFQIIHDNAKAIEFWKEMINMLSNPKKMEEAEVGYGNKRISYPLKFTKLEMVDSKEHNQVQIADIIASSICYGLKNKSRINEDEFIKGLWSSKLFNLDHHKLKPLDEPTLKRFIEEGDQEGTSSLDYLAAMQYKNG